MKVKKLNKEAIMPEKSHPTDAGYDICSIEDITVPATGRIVISTGIALDIPTSPTPIPMEIYVRVAPRSGMAIKHGIDVFAGVVDLGYKGEVKVCLYNSTTKDYEVKKGDRIAQLIPTLIPRFGPLEEVTDLEESDRGDKGFGSTGQ